MTEHDPDRDPRLDALWRETSTELPPAALDAAILAAARREVGAGPRAAFEVAGASTGKPSRGANALRPSRWWFPLAAAATIGAVAIGILQMAAPDRVAPGPLPAIVSDIPADAKQDPGMLAKRKIEVDQPQQRKADAELPEQRKTDADLPEQRKAIADLRAPTSGADAGRAAEQIVRAKPSVDAFESSGARKEIASDTAPPRNAPIAETRKDTAREVAAAPMAQRLRDAPVPAPAHDVGPSSSVALPSPASVDATSVAAAPRLAEPFPGALAKREGERANFAASGGASPAPVAAPSVPATAPFAASGGVAPASVAMSPAPAAVGLLRPSAAPVLAGKFAGGSPATSEARLDARTADKLPAAPAEAAVERKARAEARAMLPVPEWIALMRRLRDESRGVELQKELDAFRAAHADADRLLPADLRDWRIQQ